MEGSSIALTQSLVLESKHLVVGNSEVFRTCEESVLPSWWELIGVPEIAVSSVICVGKVWYVQVAPSSKWWSIAVTTEEGILFPSSDQRHFGWAQAIWVYQAKCEGLAAL